MLEELVDEGGSRYSRRAHEYESFLPVSQQNVAIWIFWSRCPPRLTLNALLVSTQQTPVLSWFASTFKLVFLQSREKRVWDAFCEQTTGLAVLSWFGFVFGWVGWELCLSNKFWTQFLHPIMFQGNLWRRPRWCMHFFVYDLSSFHPNNFRDTIIWQCFVKNDGVRSCLIELQSFLQGKIISTQYTASWCLFHPSLQVLCTTRYTQVDHIRILSYQDTLVFVHRIHRQKVCWSNFDLQVSILNW